jgi:HEAT repeat protein
MRREGIGSIACGLLGLWLWLAAGGCAADRAGEGTAVGGGAAPGPAIYIETSVTSWRKHPRAAVPLEPTIRVKLQRAGFTVVHEPSEPHAFVLHVDYREIRGREIRFDEYQTEIACDLRLEHDRQGLLGRWTIQALPPSSLAAPGSFTDTWYEFQSHPYMFFLGELARRAAAQRPDTVETLVQGLDQLAREWGTVTQERKPGTWNAHGFSMNDMPYARVAAQRTVRELARLKDSRAVPVLTSLAERLRDPWLRLDAVTALGALGAEESRPVLEAVASQDQHPDVRQAAVEALAHLKPAPQAP